MNAARLRTLPLALASVGMGVFLAYSQCDAIPAIGPVLIFITTVLLQILSNFANDYGDYVHGADHAGRVGPDRMVQSGEISPAAMLMGIRIVALLSLLSGGALLYTVAGLTPKAFIFFAIGLTAIWRPTITQLAAAPMVMPAWGMCLYLSFSAWSVLWGLIWFYVMKWYQPFFCRRLAWAS